MGKETTFILICYERNNCISWHDIISDIGLQHLSYISFYTTFALKTKLLFSFTIFNKLNIMKACGIFIFKKF